MDTVPNPALLHFSRPGGQINPLLVIARLHQEIDSQENLERARHSVSNVLAEKCSILISYARRASVRIAYVREFKSSKNLWFPEYPAWLTGFEPTKNDMIFDVENADLYKNYEFCDSLSYAGGIFAIAGRLSERAYSSISLGAKSRKQHLTLISDALSWDEGSSPLSQHNTPHVAVRTAHQWQTQTGNNTGV